MEFAILLTLLAALSWAVSGIIVRKGMAESDVQSLGTPTAFVTLTVNAAILVVVTLITGIPSTDNVQMLPALMWFAMAGITGSFLGRALLYTGIEHIGTSRANAIKSTSALFATILGVVVLGEAIHLVEVAGTLCLVAGISLVNLETTQHSDDTDIVRGSAYVALGIPFLAAIMYATTTVVRKSGLNAWHAPIVGALTNAVVGVCVVGAYLLVTDRWRVLRELNSKTYFWFALSGLATTVAWLLLYTALSLSRAVIVSPIKQMTPLFTIALSAVFIAELEAITRWLTVGTTLVVAGAALVTVG